MALRQWMGLMAVLLAVGMTVACGDDDGETSGAGGGGAGGGGMCLAFAASCDAATDTCCDVAGVTGTCFAFGMGARCTIPCPADPNDCPNNGEGCNNQSPPMCKVP